MKKTNIIFSIFSLCLLVFVTSQQAFAQVDPGFSLFRAYPQVINPAFNGAVENSELSLMHRNQWMEIAGAPKTVGVFGNFKAFKQKGTGFTLLYDQAGPVKSIYVSGDFAYHVKLNETWGFSGGIRAGVSNLSLDFAGLSLRDMSDPSFNQNFSTGIKANFGWGLRFAKKNDALYFGISQPRMIWNDYGMYEGTHKDVTMLYTILGGKYDVNEAISLNPSALIRLGADVPNSWEVNVTATMNKLVEFGLGYRSMNSYSANLGVNFNPKIYLGYLYEMPTTEINQVSNQTHEIVLKYRLVKDNNPTYYKKKKSIGDILNIKKIFKKR